MHPFKRMLASHAYCALMCACLFMTKMETIVHSTWHTATGMSEQEEIHETGLSDSHPVH